jgi:hypothetical protein
MLVYSSTAWRLNLGACVGIAGMFRKVTRPVLIVWVLLTSISARTQQAPAAQNAEPAAASAGSDADSTASADPPWQYGGFVDVGYLLDFNHPANHLFRDRSTTPRVDEVDLNMGAIYIRRDVSSESRWGMELEAQGGQDSKTFGFSPTAPNLAGANFLRQVGKANFSYLAPVGKGLTIQAGIFGSLLGYDSLYAKDNLNYTRPWGADYTPYLMLGVNASYPFNDKFTGTLFVVNGYSHLADANSVPSWGGQLADKATQYWTLKETIFEGPQQADTAPKYWRFFSDSIAEWKRDLASVAFEYQFGRETVAAIGDPNAYWMAAQLPMHRALNPHWSLTLRPEAAWDSKGRWTGIPQTIKAVTGTVEYRVPYRRANAILRLEYRYDDSHGTDAGFFRGAEIAPGVVALTPAQHLLVFGAIFAFDGQIHR